MNADMSMVSNGYSPSMASSRRHGTPQTSKSRTSASSRTMSRNVRRLQETVNLHLNNYEKELFLDALNEYHSQKDTWGFVELLRTILNTPAKQQLVPMIRMVLPPHDISEFDKCVQLSAAVARGDHGAGRLTSGATSVAGRAVHTPQSTSRKYNTAPVRLKTRPPSSSSRHGKDPNDLNIIQLVPDTDGLGFTIKPGHHKHPHGVFVSSVDPHSAAYTQGLAVGDEILEANDIDLSRTTNQDAALILQAARSLTLTVKHLAKHDAVAVRQETYTWVDIEGRSCSPPSSETEMHNTLRSSVSRRSGMTLISSQDERKINLRIEKGHGLGLTIRGGVEYGLGIYITGVDHDSAAKRSGIRVGDQILAVNEVQLVEITHKEAVKALKRSRHMMLTLKHVGKLPHAKIDQMKLITSQRARSTTSRRSRSHSRRGRSSSNEDLHRASKLRYPGSLDRRKYHEQQPQKSVFTKGAGSQLMLAHTSMMSSHNYSLVDEQARNLLNENERGTLRFYTDEYSKSHVSVDALVAALKELFNTHAKFQMFHEIRPLIHRRDQEKYDKLVVECEVSWLKSRHDRSQDQMSDFSLDSVLSMPSNSSTNDSIPSPVANQKPLPSTSHSNASTLIQNGTGSVRSNKLFITDGSNQVVVTDPQSVGSVRRRSQVTEVEINHYSSAENSPRENGKTVPRMGMRAAKISSKPEVVQSLSDDRDSGVVVNTKPGSQSEGSYTDTITRPKMSPPIVLAQSQSDHSDSDTSSLEAVREHYRQSYSLSGSLQRPDEGSNDPDSEDDRIPGLHSDLDATDNGNVILVGSKDVGTLPRRQRQQSSESTATSEPAPIDRPSPNTPTFREQVKNRSALTGKMYLPPTASQRQEIPMSDSDYDTADIINISKALYASTLNSERMGDNSKHTEDNYEHMADNSKDSSKSTHDDFINDRDALPPPPAHMLQDSNHSTAERREGEGPGHRPAAIGDAFNHIDQLSDSDAETEVEITTETETEQEVEPHPSVIHGMSPKSEKKSPRTKPGDKSTSIYAVIKKQSPKHSRPSLIFDAPPPPLIDSPTTPTVPTGPALPKRLQEDGTAENGESSSSATEPAEDSSRYEEVVRVNKLKPTLGLSVEGGAGTKQPLPRVTNIQETGCAHGSGLKIGHRILRINDKYLDGLAHNQSARIIADAFRDRKTGYIDFLVTF